LCNLFIDKEELIDPLIKMFGNNSEKEENDIPIKIRLWFSFFEIFFNFNFFVGVFLLFKIIIVN